MFTNSNYIVKPVDKALQVLTLLAEADSDLSLKEISSRSGLPKTTAFRYLYTLGAHGYVTHSDDTDLYRLGPRSWQLGQASGQYARLLEVATPLMQALRDRFDETINLGVLSRTDIVYLGIVESRRALRLQATIGGRDPAYSTSLGKAMLAFLPENQRDLHLPVRMTARTEQTLTSRRALYDELTQTQARGYALEVGENEEGACCVGAPIFNRQGQVIAAVSVSAPASRITHQQIPVIGQAVIDTAATIAHQLFGGE